MNRAVAPSSIVGFLLTGAVLFLTSFGFVNAAILTEYSTGEDANTAVGDASGVEYISAQTFQVQSTANADGVSVYLKTYLGTPSDPIECRLETISSGNPSGTLMDANAHGEIAFALLGATYQWVDCIFVDSVSITQNTTYALVLRYANNQATNNAIYWFIR